MNVFVNIFSNLFLFIIFPNNDNSICNHNYQKQVLMNNLNQKEKADDDELKAGQINYKNLEDTKGLKLCILKHFLQKLHHHEIINNKLLITDYVIKI